MPNNNGYGLSYGDFQRAVERMLPPLKPAPLSEVKFGGLQELVNSLPKGASIGGSCGQANMTGTPAVSSPRRQRAASLEQQLKAAEEEIAAFKRPLQQGDRVVTQNGRELVIVDPAATSSLTQRYRTTDENCAVELATGIITYHQHPKNTRTLTRKGV